MRRSRQGKATGRRQCDTIENAQDEGEAFRPQTFLHGPERVYRIARLDDDEAVRSKAQCSESRPIEATKLVGQSGGLAAQDWTSRSGAIQPATADAQGQGEDERSSPGRRPARALLPCRRLHFMNAADLQAFRAKQGIDLTSAEPPGRAGLLACESR